MDTATLARRGFLRGLTRLPLIGGGVALIGAPTAVAAAPTRELLESYAEWLHYEKRLLGMELYPDLGPHAPHHTPCNTGARDFHFPPHPRRWETEPQPSTRAALVLAAVGCDWQREAS